MLPLFPKIASSATCSRVLLLECGMLPLTLRFMDLNQVQQQEFSGARYLDSAGAE